MFGHHGRGMGMMMLHPKQRQSQLFGKPGAQIIGMQVTGDPLGGEFKDILHVLHTFGKKIQVFNAGQIADMLAQIGLVAPGHAEGVFQLRPAGQGRRQLHTETDRFGHIAPGAAQQTGTAGHDPEHRIINPGDDIPVMEQKKIGNAGKFVHRIKVCRADRLLASVAAGHDQGLGTVRPHEEQILERGIGEHQSQMVDPRRQGRRQAVASSFRQQDDGPLPGTEQFRLRVRDLADPARRGQVGHHDGQRFRGPIFPAPQPAHRLLAAGVHHQMKAAQAPHGDHPALPDGGNRLLHGIGARNHAALAVMPAQARPALPAGIGLGVEPAVRGIMIFPAALRAHGENLHGGIGPVIGNGLDNGITGPAVGAVDERIEIAPFVAAVVELGQTIGADRRIGRDHGAGRPGLFTVQDEKTGLAGKIIDVCAGHGADSGQRRRLLVQTLQKTVQAGQRRRQSDHHPVGAIDHRAGKTELRCQPMDKGPETDPLDHALDLQLDPLFRGRRI